MTVFFQYSALLLPDLRASHLHKVIPYSIEFFVSGKVRCDIYIYIYIEKSVPFIVSVISRMTNQTTSQHGHP